MGQPKMLLDFHGKTLLRHAVDEIKALRGSQLLVVTGCYHSLLKEILEQQQIAFVQNEQWQEGMGASIRTGIKYVMKHYAEVENVIIIVCDQPFLSADLLASLVTEKQKTGKGIAASFYNEDVGTPVLFNKKYFDQLATLKGGQGARKIVQQFISDTVAIPFPGGGTDIDTPEDYKRLK